MWLGGKRQGGGMRVNQSEDQVGSRKVVENRLKNARVTSHEIRTP